MKQGRLPVPDPISNPGNSIFPWAKRMAESDCFLFCQVTSQETEMATPAVFVPPAIPSLLPPMHLPSRCRMAAFRGVEFFGRGTVCNEQFPPAQLAPVPGE